MAALVTALAVVSCNSRSQVLPNKSMDYIKLSEESGIAVDILQELYSVKKEQKEEKIIEEPIKQRPQRTRKPRVKRSHKPHIWTNRRLDATCFRDRALTIVDLDTYHKGLRRDEHLEGLLKSSKLTQRSQLEKFTYSTRKFIAVVWLSVVRIFEHSYDRNSYFEAKRLPQRYIDPHSNLITSIHYDDEKLYIAYLAPDQPKKAFIEIRDLKSELLAAPYYYDYTVEMVQSDKDFVYIKTVDNVMHLHRKKCFHLIRYCIDLRGIINDYILCAKAQITKTNPCTKIDVLVTTTKQFLVLHLDAIKTAVAQNYHLDKRYETASVHYIENLVLIHRNLIEPDENNRHKSQLDIGLITSADHHNYFVHERTICFEYHIDQVELGHNSNIFLLGRGSAGRCEIGCLSITDFSPVWTHRLVDGLDQDAKIIVHEDHVVLYSQQYQKLLCISIEGNKFNDCEMLRNAETLINGNMK